MLNHRYAAFAAVLLFMMALMLAGCGFVPWQLMGARTEPAEAVFHDVYADTVFGSVYGGSSDQQLSPKNPLGQSGGGRPLPPLGRE